MGFLEIGYFEKFLRPKEEGAIPRSYISGALSRLGICVL